MTIKYDDPLAQRVADQIAAIRAKQQTNGNGNGNGHHHPPEQVDYTRPPEAWRGADDEAAIECVRLDPVPYEQIQPRRWLYGRFLLRGSAAVLGAVDGAGKGVITVAMILSIVTGKPLLGEEVTTPGPVAVISYEDDLTEWHRRIAAACKHYDLDYAHVLANVHFLQKPGGRVVFARRTASGGVLFPDSAAIVHHLRRVQAVALVVDPFNNAHEMEDGNSNVSIARVAGEISDIARQADVAALVLHHLRKGSSGGVDDLMGATSLRANFRGARILQRMTSEEAEALKVEDRWRYLRIAGTKENYAPPPDKATWFRLASVELGNGTDLYPEGDSVGVATSWQVAPLFEGMPVEAVREVFNTLAEAPHSPSKQARVIPWAGAPLVAIGGRSNHQAAGIVRAWLANGVLILGEHEGPQRKRMPMVTLGADRVAEILAGLAPPEHLE